jgi:transcriptional regulator
MLVLRTVASEPAHGYAIGQRLGEMSEQRLAVPQGSLYPALHRLEDQGMLKAAWGLTSTKREAKFYRITPKGLKQLHAEVSQWQELNTAVQLILAGLIPPATT